MTSNRRIRKRYLRWNRYIDHYMADHFLAPPGMLRAYNAWAGMQNRRVR